MYRQQRKTLNATVFFTKKQNGLAQDWSKDICWMNPPYGREIGKWIKKAYLESEKGATVVCLIPARTDTKYFHDFCFKGEVWFLRGRLKFSNAKNSAPFPSAIVIFRKVKRLMKFYKIRHIPSGFFYKPSKHPYNHNLSKTGKIYSSRPSLKHLGNHLRLNYTTRDNVNYLLYCNWYDLTPFVSADWEIVTYTAEHSNDR